MVESLTQAVAELLKRLGVSDAQIRVQDRETAYLVSIETADSALLIGRNGETLEALQTVIRLLSHKLGLGEARLTVDVNAYRRQREEELLTFVDEAAQRVKETGRPETLRPMNAYERHLVHEVVGQIEGVASQSEGFGPERRVTLNPLSANGVDRVSRDRDSDSASPPLSN